MDLTTRRTTPAKTAQARWIPERSQVYTKRRWRIVRNMGLLFVLIVIPLSTRWFRLNISPSVPLGVYRLLPLAAPLTRGTLVILAVPAAIRPWWHSWAALLKPVAAVAGDEVCGVASMLSVRGEDYGPIYAEAEGKPLPSIDGCQVVPVGMVFLASPQFKSLDGRYFGVTAIADLTAQAVPLWTWR